MKSIMFKESNRNLIKPASMTDEECSSLSVYYDEEESYCLSCWKPSFRERLSVLFYGRVWLWVLSGRTQPPVTLKGKKTPFVKE